MIADFKAIASGVLLAALCAVIALAIVIGAASISSTSRVADPLPSPTQTGTASLSHEPEEDDPYWLDPAHPFDCRVNGNRLCPGDPGSIPQ